MSWTAPTVFAACSLVIGLGAVLADSDVRLTGNNKGYEPEQPIHFSHRIHAGELQMDCLACHYGAERSRHAGIPPAELCMGCHAHVTSTLDAKLEERDRAEAEGREPRLIISTELRKLYDAQGLNDERLPDPTKERHPIEWVRVHNIPDFVYFDHRVHVARGLACESCHGPVGSMERIRQESTLEMGWCMDCHRKTAADPDAAPSGGTNELADGDHVSIDCARCHY